MNYQEYQEAKQAIITQYGIAEYDNRIAVNESARLLTALHGKYLADCRLAKKQQNDAQRSEKGVTEGIKVNTDELRLNGFEPVESDLKGFQGVEKDILRCHLANPALNHKQIANKFGKSYQFVAGFLNRRNVQLLTDAYFVHHLTKNTKLGMLKLTSGPDPDPRILLEAAKFLQILHNKDNTEQGSTALNDPIAEQKLKELGDQLAND